LAADGTARCRALPKSLTAPLEGVLFLEHFAGGGARAT